MNEFRLLKKGLFGTSKALDALSEKEESLFLLISDSHNSPQAVDEIILRYGKKADALLFSGDGVTDFLRFFQEEKPKCQENIPPILALVAGNCDETKHLIPPKKIVEIPAALFIETAKHRIMLTPGHRFGVDFSLDLLVQAALTNACDIAVFGHTHIPEYTKISGVTLINPGSISRPRGGSQKSFALLHIKKTCEPKAEFVHL